MKDNNRVLRTIEKKLGNLERMISKKQEPTLEDYISEQDAKKILNRGTTWFWELRKSGFPHTKVGGQAYYLKTDIVSYLESNKRGVL